MRRDILFLVHGIPPEFGLRDGHYFMASVGESQLRALRAFASEHPALQRFLEDADRVGLTCVGFRDDVEQECEAVRVALFRLHGILDGLSLLDFRSWPQISDLVFIRREASPDIMVKWYLLERWAWTHPRDKVPNEILNPRNDALIRHLLPFFDVVAGAPIDLGSELKRQLYYSNRMYRAGKESGIFGIEFLCKFSALEGMVCGPAMRHKCDLLQSRLKSLFGSSMPDIEAEVDRLWKLRCRGSHQSMAFYSEETSDGYPSHIHMDALDHFYCGAVVFALDHLQECVTLEDLWTRASEYRLPDVAATRRSSLIGRFGASIWLEDKGYVWHNVGRVFDQFYPESESSGSGTNRPALGADGCATGA